jgi:hypothetical protein
MKLPFSPSRRKSGPTTRRARPRCPTRPRLERLEDRSLLAVLTYATYVPGGNSGGDFGIAVDSAGNAYVTGGGQLNPGGTALVNLPASGGNGAAVAVDGSGNIYFTGPAPANLPVTANAAFPTGGGAFVSKLQPDGHGGFTVAYASYIPGAHVDYGMSVLGVAAGIAVGPNGNIYVTGAAGSGFTATPNAYQATYTGSSSNTNAFLAVFNPSAATGSQSLVYASYLGGSGSNDQDEGTGVAVDSAGNAYLTGTTNSLDFPTKGAFQPMYGGGSVDTFVAKFNPYASSGQASLVYSTFLGGSFNDGFVYQLLPEGGRGNGYDIGPAIAVDSSGDAYVAGQTASGDFPTTKGAFQSTFAGAKNGSSSNAYVTKLNASGSGLVYSTFLGGSTGYQGATSIVLDSSNDATVAGWTFAKNFPTKNPVQPALAGAEDAFVTTLNASGSGLLFSTYLGGSGGDVAWGVAEDPNTSVSTGSIYVTGWTNSSNFPTTPGAYQSSYGTGFGGFAFKISPSGSGPASVVRAPVPGPGSPTPPAPVLADGNGSGRVGTAASDAVFSQGHDLGLVHAYGILPADPTAGGPGKSRKPWEALLTSEEALLSD